MKAFQSVRAEMREACSGITHPATRTASAPARVVRPGPDPEAVTHIEPWMEAAFGGLTHASETGEPFMLVSCFMNGNPAVIIAATHQRGTHTHVLPLFMAVQPGMQFTPHEGDGEEGGGPARDDPDDYPEPS
jgi:hypothetical protein